MRGVGGSRLYGLGVNKVFWYKIKYMVRNVHAARLWYLWVHHYISGAHDVRVLPCDYLWMMFMRTEVGHARVYHRAYHPGVSALSNLSVSECKGSSSGQRWSDSDMSCDDHCHWPLPTHRLPLTRADSRYPYVTVGHVPLPTSISNSSPVTSPGLPVQSDEQE